MLETSILYPYSSITGAWVCSDLHRKFTLQIECFKIGNIEMIKFSVFTLESSYLNLAINPSTRRCIFAPPNINLYIQESDMLIDQSPLWFYEVQSYAAQCSSEISFHFVHGLLYIWVKQLMFMLPILPEELEGVTSPHPRSADTSTTVTVTR